MSHDRRFRNRPRGPRGRRTPDDPFDCWSRMVAAIVFEPLRDLSRAARALLPRDSGPPDADSLTRPESSTRRQRRRKNH